MPAKITGYTVCLVFVSSVHMMDKKGSGMGSAGCVVQVAVHGE